jgi:SAM-dependent methyltransferase
VKSHILRRGLAVEDGKLTWFYTALDRGNADPLTNFALDYVRQNIQEDAEILITGCGTGITAFALADSGFENIDGIDLLPACVTVAEEVAKIGNYKGTNFVVGNALNPSLSGSYDLITALHWVFSAWMGNYGNEAAQRDRAGQADFRERLLSELLAKYVPHLRPNGTFLIELTDAVTDYRLTEDHPLGDRSAAIYPIRHSPEQVMKCAREVGLELVDKKLCVSYGHHPRTLYILRRRTPDAA